MDGSGRGVCVGVCMGAFFVFIRKEAGSKWEREMPRFPGSKFGVEDAAAACVVLLHFVHIIFLKRKSVTEKICIHALKINVNNTLLDYFDPHYSHLQQRTWA